MRNFYLILFLLCTCQCFAQNSTDTIYQVDQTKFAAIVDEVASGEIVYFLPQDAPRQEKIRIARDKVWKIIYGNGETEVLNAAKPRVVQTDKIRLKNGKTIEAGISEVTASMIKYVLPSDSKERQIAISEVGKITYANGIEQDFQEKPVAQPEKAPAPTPEQPKPPVITGSEKIATSGGQKTEVTKTEEPVKTAETPPGKPNEIIIKIQHEYAEGQSGKEPKREHKGYVGIRVGGSMTSFYTDKVAWPTKPFYNWEAGLGFSLASTKHYNARLELVYANKGSKETSSDQLPEITSRTKMTYGQANLLPLILKAGGRKLNPAIGVGGYYGYLIKHVSEFKESDGEYENDDLTQELINNKSDYGALLMLAFYSGDKPLLEFRYEHGIAEVMKGLKVKNNGLSVSLFLKF
ncbi:outer membrane beta-barrel protein [Dyadobacter bucti]|uniref:outer membrane beta-barrel protein n=1 Tax=Dyadobacter bucti TaxID=2572203 RepID=UPI003F6E56E2